MIRGIFLSTSKLDYLSNRKNTQVENNQLGYLPEACNNVIDADKNHKRKFTDTAENEDTFFIYINSFSPLTYNNKKYTVFF